MSQNINAAITAVHGWTPETVLSNADLCKMVDTNDEWIRSRTGISERRILDKDKGTSHMAAEVIKGLCAARGIEPTEIDLVIVATVTPDMPFPSTANIASDLAGATNAWGFDLEAACSGFLFALNTGAQFIKTGQHKRVCVVGADKMSSIVDYTDRTTCVLFGDAAAGVFLEADTEGLGIQDSILKSDGSGREFLHMKGGGSLNPATAETVAKKMHYLFQDGKPVFKAAVTSMADVSYEIMERNGLSADDVSWLVPHQANMRIIDATARRMGLSTDKVMINIEKYGNTTAATIPLCLYEWSKDLSKGENLILSAFGGGFTWGAIWLKWSLDHCSGSSDS
jgi:3-oxoacyl-[acyl-carrier-protein] synthase-3